MAVQPIIHPRFRAFDANGDPLSGGLLYSYSAGTTTPLATYTTRAGSVANANPVVLDANGEADVWMTAGVEYKFVLKNSAGVTQWTVDNVPSTPDSLNFAIQDGNVSAPGLAFSSDVNTGFYRPAADQIAVAAGGVQAALLAATQAQFKDGSAAAPGITFLSDPDTGLIRSAANTLQGVAGGTAVVTLTAAQLTALVAAVFNEAITASKGITSTGTGAGQGGSFTGGSGGGAGASATGGGTNGIGFIATAQGTGQGVLATGGATSGPAVEGTGGAPNGIGGRFIGTGNGQAVYGTASGTGAAVDANNSGSGIAGRFVGSGTGVGVQAQGNATSAPLRLVALAAAPSAPVDGDIYYDSSIPALRCRVGGAWVNL